MTSTKEANARIGKVIDQRMSELKLQNATLARKLGVNRQRVGAWRKGNASPRAAVAEALAAELGLPLSAISADPSPVNVAERVADMQTTRSVPRIDWVSAGKGRQASDPYPMGQGRDRIEVDFNVSDGTFALDVRGDSMSPDFNEGDVIVVDPAVQPWTGCLVVAELLAPGTTLGDGDKTFKEYKRRGVVDGFEVFDLIACNPAYPTITVNQTNPGRVIGVVVETRHRRHRR